MNDLLEMLGFVLLVMAAATVAPGLALLVAGVGLILIANLRPARPKPPPDKEAAE